MQVSELTFGGLIGAAAIILLLIGIYNVCMTALKNWREEKKRKNAPIDKLETGATDMKEELKTHSQMIAEDRERLSTLEEQQRIMLRAMMAMLSHELNGNSTEKLSASVTEIQDFLIKK